MQTGATSRQPCLCEQAYLTLHSRMGIVFLLGMSLGPPPLTSHMVLPEFQRRERIETGRGHWTINTPALVKINPNCELVKMFLFANTVSPQLMKDLSQIQAGGAEDAKEA